MPEFKKLDEIGDGSQLSAVATGPLRDLQRALSYVGYNPGVIDGQIGPKTRSAWGEFLADHSPGDATTVSAAAIAALKQEIADLNQVLELPLENKDQVKIAIAATGQHLGLGLKTQIAYMLATADWETNHTFQPVKEAYWLSEKWRKDHLSYYPYYGRGYVQLTWKRNYQKYTDIIDIDLVGKPDRALDAKTALFVLVHGFKVGTFTERRLEEFINNDRTDYRNARRCINGTDKWSEIKTLAEQYEDDL